jgi:hypothetical protein
MGDFNGVQLTLVGMEALPAQQLVSSSAFTLAS